MIRRLLRLAGWNALLSIAGLCLVAGAGEVWRRMTSPFGANVYPRQFVPGVGVLGKPGAEARLTNHVDYWTVQRFNSLGFLDREPPGAGRAAQSCHVAVIGDSFVEAWQVPTSDKLQVRLEEAARRESPELDVTTSAFGFRNTGQIQQLPFYDAFVRDLHPALVVLVFVLNDFSDNVSQPPPPRTLYGGRRSYVPILWRIPLLWRLARTETEPFATGVDWLGAGLRASWFAQYLDMKLYWGTHPRFDRKRQDYPLTRTMTAGTGVALNQFKRRTDRDGARLVILATNTLGTRGDPPFDSLSRLASARGIPVLDQYAHVVRQGNVEDDASWPHDDHWSPPGHQWAAEVVLEYLQRNRDVCRRGASPPQAG